VVILQWFPCTVLEWDGSNSDSSNSNKKISNVCHHEGEEEESIKGATNNDNNNTNNGPAGIRIESNQISVESPYQSSYLNIITVLYIITSSSEELEVCVLYFIVSINRFTQVELSWVELSWVHRTKSVTPRHHPFTIIDLIRSNPTVTTTNQS